MPLKLWLSWRALPPEQRLPLSAHMLVRGGRSVCAWLVCRDAPRPIAVLEWQAPAGSMPVPLVAGSTIHTSAPTHKVFQPFQDARHLVAVLEEQGRAGRVLPPARSAPVLDTGLPAH